ncbi:hypothetical protein [Deinococcus apachensis]|uniref:hypothetical protein n=1 Tax=Deinococcus apachensis TaxID=309886 RepID=UPI00038144C8|nr:hypothetical protein [Deinococcus apachensis]
MKRYFSFLALFVLFGSALAQGDPGSGLTFDPVGWGKSPYAFGAFLLLLIAAIKRAAEQPQYAKYGQVIGNPWLWRFLAVLFGEVGSTGLYLGKFGAQLPLFGLDVPWSVAFFGLASAIVAMGFRDLLKTVIGWITVYWGNRKGTPTSAPAPEPSGPPPLSGLGDLK